MSVRPYAYRGASLCARLGVALLLLLGLATTAAASISITLTDTTTTVSASPTPSTFGQSVTFTATVTPAAPGAMTFYIGSRVTTVTVQSDGTATTTVTDFEVGTYSYRAEFSGNLLYAPSISGTGSHAVGAAPTEVAITTVPEIWTVGTNLVVTATVTAPGTTETPTGTVLFTVDGTGIPAITINGFGQATFNLSDVAGYAAGFTAGPHTTSGGLRSRHRH